MPFNPRFWLRRSHRWGAILIAAPFLLIVVTGILLQIKKEWSWVQPPTTRGRTGSPQVTFAAILDAARSCPEAMVQSWQDIERLDVQPNRGIVKVHTPSRWEIQIDLHSGEVLQLAYRRSDVIESLHDGSWFHDRSKFWVFLPTALIVLGLWLTGMYLFFMPIAVRWSRRHRN